MVGVTVSDRPVRRGAVVRDRVTAVRDLPFRVDGPWRWLLARHTIDDPIHVVVAYQADEIDVADYVGWSVCGVGEAYALVDPVRLADLAGRAPRSWRPDRDWPLISVPLRQLRGNRIGDFS